MRDKTEQLTANGNYYCLYFTASAPASAHS